MNTTEIYVEDREMEGIHKPGPCDNSEIRSSGSIMNGGPAGLQSHYTDGLGLGLDDVRVRGRNTSPPDLSHTEEYYSRSSFQAGTYTRLNDSNRDFFIEDDDEPLLNLAEVEDNNHCHSAQEEYSNRGARNQLIVASVICLVFMIGEFVGGYLANSLAIMTDAGHLLSDFASFMISLFALWLANLKPTTKMSFGFYRAEVLGAVLSILIIWVLTGILVYLAVLRFIHKNFEINADIMLITAGCGVFLNIVKDKPDIKLADPICTFIFSVLVLITTVTILRDAVYLLMEGVPKSISLQHVHDDLQAIENVQTVHSLNVWSLTVNRVALAVHLTVAKEDLTADMYQTILCKASCLLRKKFAINQITIQVEEHQDDIMSNCKECKGPCS
ncbi:zinc transporter 2-like [Anneissia japonica]|uniref:zinc transporter 2-like n=1 Tax=Anneissia japonica TaxID=1529436 RepID=UPI0014257D89|nr:zinc transporter 2-like [Anneissia japonica]